MTEAEGADAQGCFNRGTLFVTADMTAGKIEDAQLFVNKTSDGSLVKSVETCAQNNGFYTIKMKRVGRPDLITSMPCRLLESEDYHDSLEVALTLGGDIVGMNYRTRPAWGLVLFEHTTVRLNSGKPALDPEIPEKPKHDPNKPEESTGFMGIFRKYWWVFALVMVLSSVVGGK